MQDHIAIVIYWKSFEPHEKSHADQTFKNKYASLAQTCTDTDEIGYQLLWQGEAQPANDFDTIN